VALVLGLAAPAPGAALSSTAPGKPPRAKAPKGFPVPAPPAADAPLPPLLTWLTAAQTTGGTVTAKKGVLQSFVSGEQGLTRARRAQHAAQLRVSGITAHIANLNEDLARLEQARVHVLDIERRRAIRAYIDGGETIDFASLLDSASIVDPARRAEYADAAQQQDIDTVNAIMRDQQRKQALVASLQTQLQSAQHDLTSANGAVHRAFFDLVAANAALNDATHGGRVFPVDGRFEFGDSWGSYRANVLQGTTLHAHHATDIMARRGTPVVAIETGTLDRVGWNRLGGWRLWIKGVSGAHYYYAHLMAYAPKIHAGTKVVAGQYLGRVGNTGDAQGGPTHLHIEVHLPDPKHIDPSGDGITVNPYPLLCLLAGAPIPVIPPSEPPPKPAQPGAKP
jgi:murein DD-endopeptidase MepM/ murein hydrolase activator NlpD